MNVDKIAGSQSDISTSMTSKNSNLYLIGSFASSVLNFNNNISLNSTSGMDAFFVKYNAFSIGTPTLSSPSNGATNVAISPTFQWTSVTGATNYELQVSTSSNFTTTIINQTSLASTSYAGSGLSNSTQYYWRARAKNSEQTGSWSSVFNLTTVPAAPIAPTLTSPSNNAVDIATNVTLNWSSVSGATTYKVQVSSDVNFATLKVDASNLNSTSYTNSGLDRSTKYYWRAKAVNVGGESDWSTVWNFTTIASEAVPSSWAFTDFTGSTSTVLVPKNINPKIDTRDFQKGDAVGFFFTKNGALVCAGYGVWNNANLAVTVWGDNERTSEIDGSISSEKLKVKSYNVNSGRIIDVNLWDLVDVVNGNNIIDLNYSKDAFFVAKAKVLDNNSKLSLQVNPNPASDYIEITMEGESENSTLMIFSNNGKQIADLTSELLTLSGNKLRYITTNLTSGTYNLILNNGSDKIMKQIMIVK